MAMAEFRTQDVTFGSIVAGQREYDWSEQDLICFGATWFDSQTSAFPLWPTSESNLRDTDPAWKDWKTLQAGIDISAATAATPTVITTASVHGLLAANDGTRTNQVFIHDVGGVDDGYYFAKITGYSTTTFGLYSDIALATGVAGDGTVQSDATMQTLGPQVGRPCRFYIRSAVDSTSNNSGKLQIGFDRAPSASTTDGYPYVVCHCNETAAISGATRLPYSALDEMYIVAQVCEWFSAEEDVNKHAFWKQMREDEEGKQLKFLRQMLPDVPTLLLPQVRNGPFTRSARP